MNWKISDAQDTILTWIRCATGWTFGSPDPCITGQECDPQQMSDLLSKDPVGGGTQVRAAEDDVATLDGTCAIAGQLEK